MVVKCGQRRCVKEREWRQLKCNVYFNINIGTHYPVPMTLAQAPITPKISQHYRTLSRGYPVVVPCGWQRHLPALPAGQVNPPQSLFFRGRARFCCKLSHPASQHCVYVSTWTGFGLRFWPTIMMDSSLVAWITARYLDQRLLSPALRRLLLLTMSARH